MPPNGSPPDAGITRSVPAGPVWLIGLRGDFDVDTFTYRPVAEQIADVLAATERPVMFDLSQVTFYDSQLLGTLLRTAAGRPTSLAGCPPLMLRLLEITGTGHLLPAFPALDDALAYLGPKG